ncbi:MAG TPA: CGNR zinc finger domain-containing protein [Streptosporangiaceae bacterium]|nr:CGNR zinc finger domain-containing protein [Streptosporangiaceae bacterium]
MIEGNGTSLPTAGEDPGDRAPAPGSLRLIQALVNTLNAETGRDLIGTAPEAARWLTAAGLLPAGSVVTGVQRAALAELREATRQVLSGHIEQREDPEAAGRLTMALAPSRLTLAVDPAGGVRLVSADHDPFSRVIGAVAAAIAEAATAGTWARLKCCPGRRCGWAFYDRSASSRSRWCSMQICGARAKMRAYRDRLAE